MSTIQTTTNYDKFKTIIGNRELNEPHVKNLAVAIELHDLLPYFPILVNEHYEIIDGQHRFEASQRLGKPVYFIQVPGLDLKDVQKINTSSKNWTLKDYVQSYISQGNKDYEILLAYHERTGFNLTISAMLLSGYTGTSTSGGNSVAKNIKTGSFKVNARTNAEDMALYLNELQPYAEIDLPRDREFVSALLKVFEAGHFDINRLIDKLESGQKITKQPSPRHYMLEIERIYNFRAQNRIDLFTGKETQL